MNMRIHHTYLFGAWLFLSTTACANEAVKPCDEVLSVIQSQYSEYGFLPDEELFHATGHTRSYYRLILEEKAITSAEIKDLLAETNELRKTLGALSTTGRAGGLKVLLAAGVDPNLTTENETPLVVVAAACGRVDALKVLLDAGADPKAHDTQNIDAMASAVIEDLEEVANILLQYGYEPVVGSLSGEKTIELSKRLHGGRFYRLISPPHSY